jgi:hypothetical protein
MLINIQVFLFFLLNFILPILPSDGPDKVAKTFEISSSCGVLLQDSLVYCDHAYVNYCNENSISCSPNEPFIAINYDAHCFQQWGLLNHAGRMVILSLCDENLDESKIEKTPDVTPTLNEFRRITHLPYALLCDNDQFKQVNAQLFKFERTVEGIPYILIASLSTVFSGGSPQGQFDFFRKNPRCMLGGHPIGYVDITPVEHELIAAGILARVGEKIVHGPHGYFGFETCNEKVSKDRKNTGFSSLSYFTKPAMIFLIGCIACILYSRRYR